MRLAPTLPPGGFGKLPGRHSGIGLDDFGDRRYVHVPSYFHRDIYLYLLLVQF